MRLPRPFARAVKRLSEVPLSTKIVLTLSSSMSAPSLCSALAMADSTTFFIRWASQNGPFLAERVISLAPTYRLTLVALLDDHAVRALVAAGTVTLGRGTPRRNRIATSGGLAFTTTVRVIHRVHHDTAH